ncbi:energy transducer TonB [Luteimonas sp. e5]
MWWVLLAALAVGILLFLLVFNRDRQKPFYRADPAQAGVSEDGQVKVFEPLPAPLPATTGEDGDSRLPQAAIETPSTPPARIETPPASTPAAAPPATGPAAPARPRTGASSNPVPISQPAPKYPRSALRAGIGGSVQLQIDVGPDGVPTSVSIVQGSGNRELDRAAIEAARRWRFRPAMANGQPTVGRVTVPIQFTPGG